MKVMLQKNSECYKNTRTMAVKGILFHTNLKNDPDVIKNINEEKVFGLNGWIGKMEDGSVEAIQTMSWNYRPWGCGRGDKGSCNNGWTQISFCESDDVEYFNLAYAAAVELAAAICKEYNLLPMGTTDENIPVILSHHEAFALGYATNREDVESWFSKFGKTMNNFREDVAAALNPTAAAVTERYYVRKAFEDEASQIGLYCVLNNAKALCIKNKGYRVFNEEGKQVYPEEIITVSEVSANTDIPASIGESVRILGGATFADGGNIPSWLYGTKLHLNKILPNGNYEISAGKNSQSIWEIEPKYVADYDDKLKLYDVVITYGIVNVRSGAGLNYKIKSKVRKNEVFTIVEEKDGWGRIKDNGGWISLQYTKLYTKE